MFAIDTATLGIFVWTSLEERRLWTVVASAFLAIIVGSHLATLIDFRIHMNTFKFGMAMLSYGIVGCIAFGTWTSWRAAVHRSLGLNNPHNRLQGEHRNDSLSHADGHQERRHRAQFHPVSQPHDRADVEARDNEDQAGGKAKKAEDADVAR
jgi:ABC-type nickel/cobalt efflux system permease component RcnA